MVFLAAVLVPTLRRRGDRTLTASLMHGAGLQLRMVGWISFAVLVATGIVNLAYRGYQWADLTGRLWQGGFGRAFTWKMLLFGLVLLLSAAHDFWLGPKAGLAARRRGNPGAAERLRKTASWMGRLNLLLALGIVLFALFMVRGWP